jgi:hypothetical protein
MASATRRCALLAVLKSPRELTLRAGITAGRLPLDHRRHRRPTRSDPGTETGVTNAVAGRWCNTRSGRACHGRPSFDTRGSCQHTNRHRCRSPRYGDVDNAGRSSTIAFADDGTIAIASPPLGPGSGPGRRCAVDTSSRLTWVRSPATRANTIMTIMTSSRPPRGRAPGSVSGIASGTVAIASPPLGPGSGPGRRCAVDTSSRLTGLRSPATRVSAIMTPSRPPRGRAPGSFSGIAFGTVAIASPPLGPGSRPGRRCAVDTSSRLTWLRSPATRVSAIMTSSRPQRGRAPGSVSGNASMSRPLCHAHS